VDKARLAIAGWQDLGRKYNIKVCCHVHSHNMLGVNCASLSHIIKDFDPEFVGAYIDPGHMIIEGEEFPMGLAIVKDYLCAAALKDAMLRRVEKNGHGAWKKEWVEAGQGMVDWAIVSEELKRIKFQGPFSIHMELDFDQTDLLNVLKRETAFFRKVLA
jgi:sugar phosphate isomerase/epimerase